MSTYKTIKTEYKNPTELVEQLKIRSQTDHHVLRATGLYNDGYHCAINTGLTLIISMGEADNLESVIKCTAASNTDILSMLKTVAIAKKYVTENIAHMPQEDQNDYMLGINAMHKTGLYAIQSTLKFNTCKIYFPRELYNKELEFLSQNLSSLECALISDDSSIVGDSSVISWLKFIFIQYICSTYTTKATKPDIQLLDFSYSDLHVAKYSIQQVTPNWQHGIALYKSLQKHMLVFSFNPEVMLPSAEYYPYVLEQWKNRLLACTAKTVIIKIMSPLALKNSAQSLEVIVGAKDDIKEYKLKAFVYLQACSAVGHFGAVFIKDDNSLVYMHNRYKFTLPKGLEDEIAKNLLYSANTFIYTRVDIK